MCSPRSFFYRTLCSTGIIFATDINSVSVVLTLTSLWQVFCSEMPVFMREHHNGMYRTDVYFLCKTLAEVPIFLAIPVLFTSIMYYMVGLNPEPGRFFQAMLIITLVSNVATSFGQSPYQSVCYQLTKHLFRSEVLTVLRDIQKLLEVFLGFFAQPPSSGVVGGFCSTPAAGSLGGIFPYPHLLYYVRF